MRNAQPVRPTQPWWKEPWPWILIVLLGAAMAASVVTVVIASRGADQEIVPAEPGDGPVRRDQHVDHRSLQGQEAARADGQRSPAAGYQEGPAASQ